MQASFPSTRSKLCRRNFFARPNESGFSDARIARLVGAKPARRRGQARRRGIVPVYKRVDTCAAEFESYTPYLYSTYEEEDEAEPDIDKKIMILGSGPNRIGQGIEFDYCCCHAAFALKEEGFETIMVNCNPGDGVDGLRHFGPACTSSR